MRIAQREVAVAHQRHDDLGVLALAGHGDVEVADSRANVGDDRVDLRAAVGLCPVVDIDPHRPIVFADAVDAAGDMKFSAEGDLEKPVDDFGVGEGRALDRAAMGDLGVFGRGRRAAAKMTRLTMTASVTKISTAIAWSWIQPNVMTISRSDVTPRECIMAIERRRCNAWSGARSPKSGRMLVRGRNPGRLQLQGTNAIGKIAFALAVAGGSSRLALAVGRALPVDGGLGQQHRFDR